MPGRVALFACILSTGNSGAGPVVMSQSTAEARGEWAVLDALGWAHFVMTEVLPRLDALAAMANDGRAARQARWRLHRSGRGSVGKVV
jgi:hypothetical protein